MLLSFLCSILLQTFGGFLNTALASEDVLMLVTRSLPINQQESPDHWRHSRVTCGAA